MDPADNTVAAVPSNNKLLPYDERELQCVAQYASGYEDKMQKLANDFSTKGYLKLVWDSKVPKKNKRFYYFFTLKATNRDEVLAEIKKYMDFYKHIGDVVLKVREYEEEEQQNVEINPYVVIHDLKMTVKKLYKEAEVLQESTSSSTICKLHKSFIEKHEQLENMIKRVECVALKNGMVRAIDGWQKSITEVAEVRREMAETENKYDAVCEKLQKFELKTENQNEKMERLLESNKEIAQNLKKLLDENQRLSKQQETIMKENASLKSQLDKSSEQQEIIMQENASLKSRLDKSSD